MVAAYCLHPAAGNGMQASVVAQDGLKKYTIRDGKMYILLSRDLNAASLDSFIVQYELFDLNLKQFVQTASMDSLSKQGWRLELNNGELLAISKQLGGFDNFDNPASNIHFTENQGAGGNFSLHNSRVQYGYNRFINKSAFAVADSVVTFFLRKQTNSRQVILSGSFNNWSSTGLPMKLTDSGWIAKVKLGPGKYWYKFIIDGNWEVDKDNRLMENDGMGNDNSVFFKPNYVFHSHAFINVKKLLVAGSFNEWRANELPMVKTTDGWVLPVYLEDGTHTYRLVADGAWFTDPENNECLPNEFNDFNSVVRIGRKFLLKLNGFVNAKKVSVAGSFNNWKEDELLMDKTEAGWQLLHTLGAGNYEFAFKADGQWVAGADKTLLANDRNKAAFSYTVIDPNYSFKLKGFPNAKHIL